MFKATSNANKIKSNVQDATSKVKNSVESKVTKKINPPLNNNSAAGKGIICNVKKDLRSVIRQYKDHIFSKDHKEKGILNLGKSEETIMKSLYDTMIALDKKGLIHEGHNQLRVKINEIDNIEIRCFIKNGETLSFNAFISDFGRIFNNFIDTTKV